MKYILSVTFKPNMKPNYVISCFKNGQKVFTGVLEVIIIILNYFKALAGINF